MMLTRRGFMGGLVSALAAPAIVHAGNLMPVHWVELNSGWQYVCETDLYGELAAVTRKAFLPRIWVQLNTRTPLEMALLSENLTKFTVDESWGQ
jgi:hypothetical protein